MHDPDSEPRQHDQLLRDELLTAAQGYFLKHGYSRVSTAEVAEHSGRSKKTLYKHFATKEALLSGVIARLNTRLEAEVQTLLNAAELTPIERTRQVLERIGMHQAVVGAVLLDDLERREPTLYAEARHQQHVALVALVVRLLAKGVKAGVFRANIDLGNTAATFLTSVEALAKPVHLAAHADRPTAPFATLVSWLLAGIAVPGADSLAPTASSDQKRSKPSDSRKPIR